LRVWESCGEMQLDVSNKTKGQIGQIFLIYYSRKTKNKKLQFFRQKFLAKYLSHLSLKRLSTSNYYKTINKTITRQTRQIHSLFTEKQAKIEEGK